MSGNFARNCSGFFCT